MLDVCKKIFSGFIEQGVDYCHWKSNEHLVEGLNGETDLDVLVSDRHAKKFASVLSKCECIKVHPQFGSRYPNVEEWVGFDRETGKLIHLHVHFRMITGTKYLKEYVLPWHDLALSTKIFEESTGVYRIEPNLEFVILYMRIVLKQPKTIHEMDRFELSSEYRKELLWLRQQISRESLSNLLGQIWREEQASILQTILKKKLSKDDFAKLQELARDKAYIVKRGKILSNSQISIVRSRLIGMKFLLKGWLGNVSFTTLKTLYGRGCVFIFIGCDGSGKSSVTEQICKWLEWKMDCQNFYFGIGERYKKPFIYKISQSEWVPDVIRKICSMLFFYYVSVRCRYMRKIVDFYTDQGGIAVCDRYPQTQFREFMMVLSFGLCNYMMKLYWAEYWQGWKKRT